MAKYMLVSFETCPWVQRSAIVLREKNTEFELRHIKADNRPDWFLAISPHKKVPVLSIDDKLSLFESNAINEYLDETIARLKEEAGQAWIDDRGTVFNQDVLGAIELDYMVDCAETIVVGALERTESRGAQFRTDFPERNDEEWLKHIDISWDGDGPTVSYSPVTITQWQPEERRY